MSRLMPDIAMILPPREGFGPTHAGAIAMVVRRIARVAAQSVEIYGGIQRHPLFPALPYRALAGRWPWLYGLRVIAQLRRDRPDIVEIHQMPRLARFAATWLPASRVILYLHNDPQSMRGLGTPRDREAALRRLHRVVCVSDFLRRRFMDGLPPNVAPPVVIPNGICADELPPALPPAQRAPEILFAGRIVEGKGIAPFIEAVAQALPHLPGWQARILGGDRFGPDSPQTAFLSRMAALAETHQIPLRGPVSHQDVLAAMAQAAIVVVPSLWAEPFGLVALEALASGAALITTASGGLPEIAGDAALYVEPLDIPAFSAALVQLAQDPAARARLSAAGLQRAGLFDMNCLAEKFEDLRRP